MDSAENLRSIVRTMKALASVNIGQYEAAVKALQEYYATVRLGIASCLNKTAGAVQVAATGRTQRTVCALVMGSDMGLVGRFNENLATYFQEFSQTETDDITVWAVGDRIAPTLAENGFSIGKTYSVPNSVEAIAPLVARVLTDSAEALQQRQINELYVFYHQPVEGAGSVLTHQRILPIDSRWQKEFEDVEWPTDKVPEVIGTLDKTLEAFIQEYLFVSLFKAFSESLASENASRLAAMQRAEKNIDETLDEMTHRYHMLRQNSIDEELFDVISGFEALSKKENR